MYNFNFTIPSVLILCILLGYFLSQPRLPVRQNRLFFGIMMLEILVVLFDILSSQADMNYERLSLPLVSVLNMAFFVLFLARIYWFFLYLMDVVGLPSGRDKRTYGLFSLVFLVSEGITLSSFWTGAVYSIDAAGYHRGPLYSVLYVCFFFYLLLGIVLTLLYRRRLDRHQLSGSLWCSTILILGNVVRMLLPQYLVMNTFCLMAILVIYLSFENPARYVSSTGGFTLPSMHKYMAERIPSGNYRILGFTLPNYVDSQAIYGVKQMEQGVTLICDYIQRRYPRLVFFYLRQGCFALVGPASMDHEKLRTEITERFRQPWQANGADLYLNVNFAHLSDASGMDSADRVVDSLLLALFELSDSERLDDAPIDVDHAESLERELAVKRALDRAVETGGVEIFLQPIILAQTGALVGAEALARLRDEQGKLIRPDEFIPMAEKNGQINRLGDQVAEGVCRFLRDRSTAVPGLRWVNMNLSPVQCMDRGLCRRLTALLEQYGVLPHCIHLEITEASMIDFSLLLEQMSELWKAGFSFSLDDYGSGYSNMSRLRCFPFSNIKLDMDVVWAHCADPDQVLPTFVEVFKDKGYSIVAEGIETEEMARTMRDMGCDYLQGFYYSRPLSIDDFIEKYGA